MDVYNKVFYAIILGIGEFFNASRLSLEKEDYNGR
jgi:hypothetical protein